jgi:hypothetical protein
MFINKEGVMVNSTDELFESGQDWEGFLRENVPIWKKTIQALGYSFIEQEDSLLPIWLKKPLPGEYGLKKARLFVTVKEYDSKFDDWMCENLLKEEQSIGYGRDNNWSPNFIPRQAQALERRLLSWGKYKTKDTDFNAGENGIIAIKYSGSEIYKDIYNVGKSEPDIICRSFVQFIDNRRKLRRKI